MDTEILPLYGPGPEVKSIINVLQLSEQIGRFPEIEKSGLWLNVIVN